MNEYIPELRQFPKNTFALDSEGRQMQTIGFVNVTISRRQVEALPPHYSFRHVAIFQRSARAGRARS
jgi:hypothetical protein